MRAAGDRYGNRDRKRASPRCQVRQAGSTDAASCHEPDKSHSRRSDRSENPRPEPHPFSADDRA